MSRDRPRLKGRAAEAGRVERLRLLEAALASCAEGIVVVDPDGRLAFMNEAGRRIAGRLPSTEAPVEEQAADFRLRYPDGRPLPSDETPLGRALRGETVVDFLAVVGRPDGADVLVSTTASPVQDEEGRVVGAVSAFRDVTAERRREAELAEALARAEAERRRAEALARQAQQQAAELEAIVESMVDAVYVLDPEGMLVRANRAGLELLGLASKGEAARPLPEYARLGTFRYPDGRVIPPEEYGLARALRGETFTGYVFSVETPDGHVRWANISGAPVRDERGDIVAAVNVTRDITAQVQAEAEQKQVQEALRESEERLRLVVANSPDTIFIQDRDLRYTWIFNPAPPLVAEEVVGKTDLDLLPPEEALPLTRMKRQILDSGVGVKVEVDLSPGGLMRAYQVDYEPLRDREGQIIGIVAYARDVTERKRAEEERERLLREVDAQRRLFEIVVESVPVGIVVLRGPNFVFELVNPGYQAIAPGKAMPGRTVAEVWPELADWVLPVLTDVLRSGRPYRAVDAPFSIRRAPEATLEDRCFTFDYIPLRTAEGPDDAVLVVAVETTEQVRARNRVEELATVAQRRAGELQAVLDNMVDGVFVCDPAGRITLANEAGVRLFGIAGVEEVRRALAEFPDLLRVRHLDGRLVAPAELPLARALAGKTIALEDEIIANPRTGQDVHVRTSAAPIRDAEGKVVAAVEVARDVTELTELDRLKEHFIRVAAHELKTPVAIMKGYAQVLLRTADELSPPHRRMLDAVDRGADRITRIVEDLLDISQLHAGRLELASDRIALPALAEEVVDRMALMASRHRIRVVEAEPVVVRGDRDRLDQVLVNLVDNAITYSPNGGDVDVAVAVRDGEAVVSVRDRGVGIPREKQPRIFQRFYRAHTATPHDYGGMGVGLYISREIVARHGGRMWFESEEDRGSTFSFSLPLRTSDE